MPEELLVETTEIAKEDGTYEGPLAFSLGMIFATTGRPQQAVRYLTAAKILLSDTNNVGCSAACQLNLGILLKDSGHNDDALQNFNEAREAFQNINDRRSVAACLFNIGTINQESGRIPGP
ncbi:hypothetical protein BT69DRAFT_1338913 [Atractiella rhizophila]|nr:hypothetical protein BT69DRAFT_1338913 [Atractiella rhizophila]